MTKLVVEAVHQLTGRPWILVTGRLEDGDLRIGDQMWIAYQESAPVAAVVRTIELHAPVGRTTIAIDASLAGQVGEGAVLTLGG